MFDLGLVAGHIAEVELLLIIYNKHGPVEGVKYDRIGVVLMNIVKEQQKEIERLKDDLAELKALMCASSPGASVCTIKD